LSTAVVAGLVTVAVVAGALLRAPHGVPPEEARATTSGTVGQALRVLAAWDRRRADAWGAGAPVRLARLYAAGSQTGRRDVRALARWHRRGLRVVGLHQQVAAAQVLAHRPGRVVLRVTDRTLGGVAVGGPHRVGLPQSLWRTHRVVLSRSRGTWRVVEARAQPAR
jgi:hypothetical protein